ncbi:MAG: riboflavin kinase, partial [Vampirovibrionales bacterium]|nr:riboflavin kinase [Vampirovibrionales bacterium]
QSNPPFKTTIMQPVTLADHQIISSTQIRKLLQYGDVTQAAALLGRPYDISGVLTTGHGRASQLGYPTANITLDAQRLMPAVGVYMGYLQLLEPNRPAQPGFKLSSSSFLNPSKSWPAVCNIGFSPTVLLGSDRPSAPRLEVHALLAHGQAFPKLPQGSLLSFSFLRRLRDEQKFESLEALIAQIAIDCDQAKDAFHQLMASKVDSF